MASVESIGSCSLDFDASESKENGRTHYTTASEFTLQSEKLLSINSSLNSAEKRKNLRNEDTATFRTELVVNNSAAEKNVSRLSNGHGNINKTECTVAEIKLPSYVSISCAINGYANYSRFCRSRDNSPARALRKSSLEASHTYDSVSENTVTPSNVRCSRSYSDCNGNSQTIFMESKHVNISKQLQIPLITPKNYTSEIVINNGHSPLEVLESFSPKVTHNGHNDEKFPLAKEVGNGSKSLVQQRIESLYGVSAEEKAKFPIRTSRFSTSHSSRHVYNSVITKRSPSCPPEVLTSQLDNKLPVFRHLRKDFREQLLLEDSASTSITTHKDGKIYLKKSSSDNTDEKNDHGFHSLPNDVGSDECDRSIALSSLTSNDVNRLPLKPTCKEKICTAKDGRSFLATAEFYSKEIKEQVERWNNQLQEDIPDEVAGKIRAACGKANLLLSQKFEQFRGLCVKNIEEDPDTPYYTTASDLEGFWDMVMLQVKDVIETFNDIEAMKDNNWQEVKKDVITRKPRKSTSGAVSKSNPCTPKRGAKSAELAKAREEARKQLIAAKRKGRQQNANVTDNDVSIYTSS